MKNLLSVCLLAVSIGWTGAPHASSQTAPLQKGVSVQMAVTNNASPMPEADKQDAWVIAVTAAGELYFGTQAVTPEQLVEEMKMRPRNRNAKIYIKADSRAPYANVRKALDAAKAVLFSGAVLLTKQPESPALVTMIPPKGLEVLLTAPSSQAVPVRVLASGQKLAELEVNDRAVSIAGLQSALNQALQNRSEKAVQISADSQLPFAQVVAVIDAIRSVGAKTVLPASEM
jgi:biopolymer transport protein ExbD